MKRKNNSDISSTIEAIDKEFGVGSVMYLGKSKNLQTEVIPTGSIALNKAMGIGGFPKGRIVEVFGPESSGKSTLALHAVCNCQKAGGRAAYIDAEHALDPGYANSLGVNDKELLISQPNSGEEALNIADMLSKSNEIDLIIIDSVAALVPKNEIEGKIGDQFIGLQARMMSQALRKLSVSLFNSNTCCLFINQIREKVGVMFGNPEVTTGGRALKFYASIRLDIRRIGSIKNSDNLDIGNRCRVKVVKNKMSSPFRMAEFDIIFNQGICRYSAAIDLGINLGIIERNGSWISFATVKSQGKDPFREELKKHKDIFEKLEKEVVEKFSAT